MLFSLSLLAVSQLLLVSAVPLQKRAINGPVISSNFPDPAFIQVGSQYFAFGTNGGGKNVPVATSSDFNAWDLGGDALPTVGAWSSGANVWAPDVVQLNDGSFVLYYAATSADPSNSVHCIGAATSSSAAGPYTPLANSIACAADQGGAIDPAGFQDADGTMYVVYKIDGNNRGHGGNCGNSVDPIVPTPIMLQQLASDGVTPVGNPQQILDRGEADGPLVEAPSLTRVADSSSAGGWLYILFFSSNCYSGDLYDTSYATSSNGIKNGGGDYAKAGVPLLVTGSDGGKLYSPGGLDVGPDASKVVFHADLGTSVDTRQMWAGQITVDVGGRTVSI